MSSGDTTKLALAATALVAGGAGAALSYYLAQRRVRTEASSHSLERLNSRTSFIFQDPEYDLGTSTHSSSGAANDRAVLLPHSHEERMRRRIASRIAVEDENSMPRQSVTVRVPATSANCGPGYDSRLHLSPKHASGL